MIKFECDVTDLQALLSRVAEMQAETERLRFSACEAWKAYDEKQATITRLQTRAAQLEQSPAPAHVSWQTIEFVKELIQGVIDHNKIKTIKAVRSLCGPPSGGPLELKGAKDLVETFTYFKPLPPNNV